MLIVLCILCPPAIPFVLLYYVLGTRRAARHGAQLMQRQNLLTDKQTAVMIEVLQATADPEAYRAKLARHAEVQRRLSDAADLSRQRRRAILAGFLSILLFYIMLAAVMKGP